jgi:hypothetical protein
MIIALSGDDVSGGGGSTRGKEPPGAIDCFYEGFNRAAELLKTVVRTQFCPQQTEYIYINILQMRVCYVPVRINPDGRIITGLFHG